MSVISLMIGNNNYKCLGADFYSPVTVQKIYQFGFIECNHALFETLQLTDFLEDKQKWLELLIQNSSGTESCLAMAYAGHQFGHFTMLGDGRACLLKEVRDHNQQLVDLHLKGCGPTPYSRSGDGNASLAPMAREYLISEAMHGLGIPTTRALALITTGNPVYRESIEDGAILVRHASSHLRVGTFEYARAFLDLAQLKTLFEYAANRHYPEVLAAANPPLSFLEVVLEQQLQLVCEWLRVGFIHGVMNTDNTTISGETIDYGPCAFLDEYDPAKVFSSIDTQGRYAFANQPHMIFWNISRLAETLLPLIDRNEETALELVQSILEKAQYTYLDKYWRMMAQKIGFTGCDSDVKHSLKQLLNIMHQNGLDYTNTFLAIEKKIQGGQQELNNELECWVNNWQQQLKQNNSIDNAMALMQKSNPRVISRNHLVHQALEALTNQDDTLFKQLLARYQMPYDLFNDDARFQAEPKESERVHRTFCGT